MFHDTFDIVHELLGAGARVDVTDTVPPLLACPLTYRYSVYVSVYLMCTINTLPIHTSTPTTRTKSYSGARITPLHPPPPPTQGGFYAAAICRAGRSHVPDTAGWLYHHAPSTLMLD